MQGRFLKNIRFLDDKVRATSMKRGYVKIDIAPNYKLTVILEREVIMEIIT